MDLVKNGETKAFVTVHLGGDLALHAAHLLIRKFQEKTGIKLDLKRAVGFDDITRSLQISLCTSAGFGVPGEELTTPDLQGRYQAPPDGFVADLARIGKDIGVVMSALDLGCLVSAIGELLRSIEFGKKDVRLVRLPPKIFRPYKELRGVCLTMPSDGEFSVWPEAEMRAMFEEWAVWGYNVVLMRHVMHAYRSDFRGDPKSAGSAALRRYQLLARIAHEFGMKAGLVTVANSAYQDRAMVDMRAVDSPNEVRRGGSPTLLCPSTHQGRAYLLEDRESLFREVQPVDVVWLWPFDPGGCWCERCRPWAKTFLGLAQEIARSLKRYHSRSQAYVHTRWFMPEDYDVLERYLETGPDWLDGIVLDEFEARRGQRSAAELKRLAVRFSAKTKVVFSPAISLAPFPAGESRVCYDQGRLGANPRIGAFYSQYAQLAPSLSGIVPTSETAGDDLTKAAYIRWGWSAPERAEDVVNEYCQWYLNLKTDAGLELVRTLDLNPTHEQADGVTKEENALEAAKGQIPPEFRENWRWKVFEARVALDRLLCRIELKDEALAQLGTEMRRAVKGRTTKAGLQKAVTEALDRLREREKLVEKLAQTADELQHRVYRVGPERDLITNGWRLAEDCGRGSLKGWVSRLQAAANKKGFAELREAVKGLVETLGGQG
jgi:hypothetical protein